MRKLLTFLVSVFLLKSCASPGESTTGRLGAYQYTPVQNMGNNQYWVQGYDTEDAITGAKAHCSKISGNFVLVQMQPHSQTERATLIFKCQ